MSQIIKVACRLNGVSHVDFKIVACRCVEFKNIASVALSNLGIWGPPTPDKVKGEHSGIMCFNRYILKYLVSNLVIL